MKRKFAVSLGTKCFLTILCMSLLIGGLMIFFSYQIYQQQINDSYDRSSEATAETCLTFIDADTIAQYYSRGIEDEAYDLMLENLRLCADAANTRSLYIFVPTEEGCIFVFDSDKDARSHRGLGDLQDWDTTFGGIDERILKGEEIDSIISEDSLGWLLTNLTAIYNDEGSFIAYLAIEYSAIDLVGGQQRFVSQLAITALVVSVIMAYLFLIVMSRSVIRPLNQITQAVRNYLVKTDETTSQAKSITALDIRTHDELEVLSDALKTMEHQIQDHLKNTEENASS